MSKVKKITPYQIFGWTPLLVTVVVATTIAVIGIMNGIVSE
jgi:hypothetical protein